MCKVAPLLPWMLPFSDFSLLMHISYFQLVSPPPVKTTPIGEITLDSSGPYLNTSADIEVLSPYGTSAHSKEGRATNAGNVMQKNVSSQYNVESSPYRQNLKNSSSISDQQKVGFSCCTLSDIKISSFILC